MVTLRVASHQRKTMKTSLRPAKSKDVVRTWSKLNHFRLTRSFYVLTTSLPRPYYVRTASLPGSYYVHQVSNEFLPRAYHAHPVYSTLILRSQHDQADHTTRLPRFQHVLTAYSLLYRTYFTTTNSNIFN